MNIRTLRLETINTVKYQDWYNSWDEAKHIEDSIDFADDVPVYIECMSCVRATCIGCDVDEKYKSRAQD